MSVRRRCVRLWVHDGQSQIEEGVLVGASTVSGDESTGSFPTTGARLQSSPPGSRLDWHNAPARQLILILQGTLRFTTRTGQSVIIHPGDALLAEDTTGGGHRWELIDDQPWERLYLVVAPDTELPYQPV